MVGKLLDGDNIQRLLCETVPHFLNEGVIISDVSQLDQPVVYVNTAFEQITGYKKSDIVGKNCRILQGTDKFQPAITYLRRCIQNQLQCIVTLRNYKKNGDMFWSKLSLYPVLSKSNDGCRYYICIQNDISHEIQLDERVKYLYEHDADTNLYNYLGYYERTMQCIEEAILLKKFICVGLIRVDFLNMTNDNRHDFSVFSTMKKLAGAMIKHFSGHAIIAKLFGFQFVLTSILKTKSTVDIEMKLSSVESEVNQGLPLYLQFSLSYSFHVKGPDSEMHIDQIIQSINRSF